MFCFVAQPAVQPYHPNCIASHLLAQCKHVLVVTGTPLALESPTAAKDRLFLRHSKNGFLKGDQRFLMNLLAASVLDHCPCDVGHRPHGMPADGSKCKCPLLPQRCNRLGNKSKRRRRPSLNNYIVRLDRYLFEYRHF